MSDCPEHWPAVFIGPGGYPFIRCHRCPHIIPRDEAPASLLLDCESLLRGESSRPLTATELTSMGVGKS